MVKTKRLEFAGGTGEMLAARLDMPASEPRAFALFAHCFTCSKDLFAASRIARALTDQAIAVLRFDFTGLGASKGEFSNTGFSSNIADIVAAARFLQREYAAPELLIGHSLGGAAVLAAAAQLEPVRAVATIGAPADVDHVLDSFKCSLAEIEKTGRADVTLAGRTFSITSQFIDDVRGHNLKNTIAGLKKKALLVMHSPRDEIVGIDNASEIFTAARHPKSFISLDDADHLLSRRRDAVYAAGVIAAWADRYISQTGAQASVVQHTRNSVHVEETGASKFQQLVIAGNHRLFADEPENAGGADTGPSPYDFLSIALGACTTMTLRMYADHKGYDLGKLSVEVSHAKVHADDCADCGEGLSGRIDRFERTISFTGDVPGTIARRLLAIADKCPVHKTLKHSSAIVTKLPE